MVTKRKRRVLWIDEWRLDELESWFSDMAAEGLHFISMGSGFATFEEARPENVTYRCDVFNLDNPSDQSRMELYRESGWEYVADRKLIHVFKEVEEGQAQEVYSTLEDRVTVLKTLKANVRNKALLALTLLILMSLVQISTIRINAINNYLNDIYITSFYIIALFLYRSLHLLLGWFYVSNYIRKVKTKALNPRANIYKTKVIIKKYISILAILLLIILGVNMTSNIIKSESGYFSHELPEHNSPAISISDVVNQSVVLKENSQEDENYYFINSSILVPRQMEVFEDLIVPDEKGEYSISLTSSRYQARYEWIALRMIQELKRDDFSASSDFQLEEREGFDELWTHMEDSLLTVIARIGNGIYHVTYHAEEITKDERDEILNAIRGS